MELNPQCEITIKEARSNYVWVRGTSASYKFVAKVYCAGSKHGIDKGRISKFAVWINLDERGRERWIARYDRGWDVYTKQGHRQFVDYIIGLLEAMPQPEELKTGMCFPFD